MRQVMHFKYFAEILKMIGPLFLLFSFTTAYSKESVMYQKCLYYERED